MILISCSPQISRTRARTRNGTSPVNTGPRRPRQLTHFRSDRVTRAGGGTVAKPLAGKALSSPPSGWRRVICGEQSRVIFRECRRRDCRPPPPLPPKGSESENRTKLRKALRECRGYIEANRAFIPNYGVRGIGGKPGDQQADGEETANAVEQEGRAPDDVYRRSAEGRCSLSMMGAIHQMERELRAERAFLRSGIGKGAGEDRRTATNRCREMERRKSAL